MQKLINVLAVLSFVGVSGIIGTGAAVYLNREALAEQARERITKAQQQRSLMLYLECWTVQFHRCHLQLKDLYLFKYQGYETAKDCCDCRRQSFAVAILDCWVI